MRVHIVMDQTGDSRHTFDPADAEAVRLAEERFKELTGAGFTAAERTGAGEAKVTRTFNPEAPETLFFPRLQGG
ncbi:hypothetical protein ACVWW6_006011 [Bradyrhizobium sp. USDA 3311]